MRITMILLVLEVGAYSYFRMMSGMRLRLSSILGCPISGQVPKLSDYFLQKKVVKFCLKINFFVTKFTV